MAVRILDQQHFSTLDTQRMELLEDHLDDYGIDMGWVSEIRIIGAGKMWAVKHRVGEQGEMMITTVEAPSINPFDMNTAEEDGVGEGEVGG